MIFEPNQTHNHAVRRRNLIAEGLNKSIDIWIDVIRCACVNDNLFAMVKVAQRAHQRRAI